MSQEYLKALINSSIFLLFHEFCHEHVTEEQRRVSTSSETGNGTSHRVVWPKSTAAHMDARAHKYQNSLHFAILVIAALLCFKMSAVFSSSNSFRVPPPQNTVSYLMTDSSRIVLILVLCPIEGVPPGG